MTKVLIALTGATEWSLKDGSTHAGGFWSPEFVYPHDRFTRAGYDITIATPGGDEVDLIVGEPVFVAVLVAARGILTARDLLDALGHRVGLYHPESRTQSPAC